MQSFWVYFCSDSAEIASNACYFEAQAEKVYPKAQSYVIKIISCKLGRGEIQRILTKQ